MSNNKQKRLKPIVVLSPQTQGCNWQQVCDHYRQMGIEVKNRRLTEIGDRVLNLGLVCGLTSLFAAYSTSSLFPRSTVSIHAPRLIPIIPFVLKIESLNRKMTKLRAEHACYCFLHDMVMYSHDETKQTQAVESFIERVYPQDLDLLSLSLKQQLLAQSLLSLKPKKVASHSVFLKQLFDVVPFDNSLQKLRIVDSHNQILEWSETRQMLAGKLDTLLKNRNQQGGSTGSLWLKTQYFEYNRQYLNETYQARYSQRTSPPALTELVRRALIDCCSRRRLTPPDGSVNSQTNSQVVNP